MNTHKEKILIVYATAGAGHKKAAEAIYHEVTKTHPETKMVDIVDFMSPLSKKIYSDGYAFLISRLTRIWGIVYFLSDTPALNLFNVHLRRFVDVVMCRKFTRFLIETKPDIVISAQFLASEMVSYAKAKHNLQTQLITVVTDFGVHNFWINPLTDIYCVAASSTKEIILKKGIPEKDIRVTGIPVDEKFLAELDRKHLCDELKIRRDVFTVLIMTGGVGIGPIEDIVEQLKDVGQLLVICGNNKTLYEKLEKKNYTDVRLFGFVNFVEKLMKASDCIVTKAGGLSVTESLIMGLPMVFFFLIPGQELMNAKNVESLGAGFIAQSVDDIQRRIVNFRDDHDLLCQYKKVALSLAKPQAARQIASLIE